MIQINKLTKTLYGGGHRVDVLNDIDLTVPSGQFAAITGASGSGKTTLLSLIAGLDTPTSGSVVIDGKDITKMNEDELAILRGERFGFIFQNFHLIPTLTAVENALASPVVPKSPMPWQPLSRRKFACRARWSQSIERSAFSGVSAALQMPLAGS